MSEVRFSAMELRHLQATFELVLEELEGIEEIGNTSDYILTTGAKEGAEECLELCRLKEKFLEPDSVPLELVGEMDIEDDPTLKIEGC